MFSLLCQPVAKMMPARSTAHCLVCVKYQSLRHWPHVVVAGSPDRVPRSIWVSKPTSCAARKAHPALRVADLETCRQMLSAAGVQIVPDTTLPEVRRFYAADPFGNRIEFIQDGDGFAN